MKFLCIVVLGLLCGCASVTTKRSDNGSTPSVLNVVDYGAVGDGKTNCTASLQRAIDACAGNGGGTVVVPAGKYVTGTLWMRSHINLYIDSGATLLGSQNVEDFPYWTSKWEGDGVTGETVRHWQ